ncbi:MAG: ECF subfamily RNA polymerase sigma-24 factor [Elusimicrobia bacterium]|nr:MAG: ECF subfamily RNA polymerase sigma-24 factor [Elusimicrobiota bacterium]
MTAAGDFSDFIARYEDMVYTTAYRLLGRAAEAEDASAEAFLKAFERFDSLKGSPAAGGWLKTVVTNQCLNHLSRHRARFKLFSELEDEGAPFDAPEPAAAAPDFTDSELEAAVAVLPDHQRVPLVLFHFEDRSYEDIAASLGVSLPKIKTDIFRARAALRRALEAK